MSLTTSTVSLIHAHFGRFASQDKPHIFCFLVTSLQSLLRSLHKTNFTEPRYRQRYTLTAAVLPLLLFTSFFTPLRTEPHLIDQIKLGVTQPSAR